MKSTVVFLCVYFAVGQEALFEKFTATYKGEGVNCGDVRANVTANSNLVTNSKEGVALAVAEAVADASSVVLSSPNPTTLIAEAQAVAEIVVNVVSRAVAFVSGEINSPNAGCWAIAFGKAEAIAIANATAFGIADGLAIAALPQNKFVQAQAAVQSIENDVKVAVETVALLLADGSGKGLQQGFQSAEAVAKAEAINCALVAVFVGVSGIDAVSEVYAEAGCIQISTETGNPSQQTFSQDQLSGCTCVTPQTNLGVVPNFCGQWGDQQSGDTLCYVENPQNCVCAQASVKYGGAPQSQAWRYCGQTLREMQSYLMIQDESNNINMTQYGYGYCPPEVEDSTSSQRQSSVPVLSQDIVPPNDFQNPFLAVDDYYTPIDMSSSPLPLPPPSPMILPSLTLAPMAEPTPAPIPMPMYMPLTPSREPTVYASPTPTPTPTPTSMPVPDTFQGSAVELISQCPLFYCVDESFECCKKSTSSLGSQCDTSNGLRYVYVGKCATTLQDVWQPLQGNTCKCIV